LATVGMTKDTMIKHKEAAVISLREFLIFLIKNFGQKRPIIDRRKKNLLVILNLSNVTWPCTF
jgi:hypothetical protein